MKHAYKQHVKKCQLSTVFGKRKHSESEKAHDFNDRYGFTILEYGMSVKYRNVYYFHVIIQTTWYFIDIGYISNDFTSAVQYQSVGRLVNTLVSLPYYYVKIMVKSPHLLSTHTETHWDSSKLFPHIILSVQWDVTLYFYNFFSTPFSFVNVQSFLTRRYRFHTCSNRPRYITLRKRVVPHGRDVEMV